MSFTDNRTGVKKMKRHCKRPHDREINESKLQTRVEPLDEIQFDHDEEIKVPV